MEARPDLHGGSSLGPHCREGLGGKAGGGAVLQGHEQERFQVGALVHAR